MSGEYFVLTLTLTSSPDRSIELPWRWDMPGTDRGTDRGTDVRDRYWHGCDRTTFPVRRRRSPRDVQASRCVGQPFAAHARRVERGVAAMRPMARLLGAKSDVARVVRDCHARRRGGHMGPSSVDRRWPR